MHRNGKSFLRAGHWKTHWWLISLTPLTNNQVADLGRFFPRHVQAVDGEQLVADVNHPAGMRRPARDNLLLGRATRPSEGAQTHFRVFSHHAIQTALELAVLHLHDKHAIEAQADPLVAARRR